MFRERRHDFGSVAIGVDASHAFKFRNLYKHDIEITSIRSSCGCTTYSVSKTHFQSGETGEVVAKLNTSGQFEKDKSATLTVVFSTIVGDKPVLQEAQLQVTSYIRPDVVINPGIVEFGSVRQGKSVTKQLTMQYAGRNDWRLLKIEKNSPNIRIEAVLPKERVNGRVTYDIFVTLKEETPPGYLQDMVRFITNDPNPDASSIMLPIHGYVSSPLSVRPSPLIIGNINPGETITKNIVIRGDTPFQIAEIHSADPRFKFNVSKQSNRIHVVPVSFRADQDTGLVESVITVATSMNSQKKVELLIQGNITGAMQDRFPRQMMADHASPLLTEETRSSFPGTDSIFVPSGKEKSAMKLHQSVVFPDPQTRQPAKLSASLPGMFAASQMDDDVPNPSHVDHDESDMTLIAVSEPSQLKKATKPNLEKEHKTVASLPDQPCIAEDIFTVTENFPLNTAQKSIFVQVNESEKIENHEEVMTIAVEADAVEKNLVVAENLFQEITPTANEEAQEVVTATKLKFVTPKIAPENENPSVIASSASSDPSADGFSSTIKDFARPKTTPPVPGMNLTRTMGSGFSPLIQDSPVIPHLVLPKLGVNENPSETVSELSPLSMLSEPEVADFGENEPMEPKNVKTKSVLIPFSSPEGKQTVNTISSQNNDFSSLFTTSEKQPLSQTPLNRQGIVKRKIIEPRGTQKDSLFELPESPLVSQTPLPEKSSVQKTKTPSAEVGKKPVLIQPGAIPMTSSVNSIQGNALRTVVPPPPRLR